MKTITTNANRAKATSVPRPYDRKLTMPDIASSSAMIGENTRPRSGQDAQDHRLGIVSRAVLDLGRVRGAYADHGARELQRHAGQRVIGVEHDLVFGDVRDREKPALVCAAWISFEPHAGLEGFREAAARLYSEQVLIVVAEGILGLEPDVDAILHALAFEGDFGCGENISIAPVQILQGLVRDFDGVPPDVREDDIEGNDRIFRDAHRPEAPGSCSASAAT